MIDDKHSDFSLVPPSHKGRWSKGTIFTVIVLVLAAGVFGYYVATNEPSGGAPTNTETPVVESPNNGRLSDEEIRRMLDETEAQRKKSVEDAVAKFRAENIELSGTLLKSYPNLPAPKEDAVSIEAYRKVIESHSGNSELYVRVAYSKLVEELNDYAGELGTKASSYFECNKQAKSCKLSDIVDKAVKLQIKGYYPGLGFCFHAWDAEKQRMFSSECGGPEVAPSSQFNYGENKFYQFSNGDGFYGFLGINKQLTRIAMAGVSNKIIIYHTDKPSVAERSIDYGKFVLDRSQSHLNAFDFNFKWNDDGDTGLLTLQGRFYVLNASTDEIRPQ